MAALAVTTAVSADESVARAVVRGLDLIVTAVAPGQTVVTVTTDSNGRMATCSFMATVTAATVAGDVNGDGNISIADVTMLIDVILSQDLDGNAQADVNQDGAVNIIDVTALIDMLLKKN